MHDDHPESTGSTLQIPEPTPITPEEIKRRRVLIAEARVPHEEIDPIGVSVEDLIHELRGGDDRFGN